MPFGVTDGNIENGAAYMHTVVHWSAPPQSKDLYLNPYFLLLFSFHGQILNWLFVSVSITDLLFKGEEYTFYMT